MPRNKGRYTSQKTDKGFNFSADKIQFFNEQEKRITAALIAADQELKRAFFPGKTFLSAVPGFMLEIGEGLYDPNKEVHATSYMLMIIAVWFFFYEKNNTPIIDMNEKIASILQRFLENDLIEQEDILSIDVLPYQNPHWVKLENYIFSPALMLVGFSHYLFTFIKALDDHIKDAADPMPKLRGFAAVIAWVYLFCIGIQGRHQLQNDMQKCLFVQQKEIEHSINTLLPVIGEEKAEIILKKAEQKLFGNIEILFYEKINFGYSEAKVHHKNILNVHDVSKELIFVLGLLGIHGCKIQEGRKIGIRLISAFGQKKSFLTIEQAKEILHERLVFRENIKFFQSKDPNFTGMKGMLSKVTGTHWYVSKINRDNRGMLCFSTRIHIPEEVKTLFNEMAARCPNMILKEDHEDETYHIYCVDIAIFSAEMHSYSYLKEQERNKKKNVSILEPMREWDVLSSPAIGPSAKKRVKKPLENINPKAEDSRAIPAKFEKKTEVKRLNSHLRFIGLEQMERDIADSDASEKVKGILSTGRLLAPSSQGQQGLKRSFDTESIRVKMKGYGGGLRPLFIFNSEKSQEQGKKVYEYKGLVHK